MLSEKDKLFISDKIQSASAQEIKEFALKCAEILSSTEESKTPPEDLNPGEGDLIPSLCGPSIFVYWNGPSDEKIKHGERLEYLSWHKDGERIGVKGYSGGVHFVARNHISAEPSAKFRPINPNSLWSSEEERQEFINKFGPGFGHAKAVVVRPECQNPTALMLRQIADQIDSGDKIITSMVIKNETKEGMPTEDGWRTISATGKSTITVEIVEDLAQ